MTQREFMQELVAALAEELPAEQVEEHRRFYESYFADERRKGRSEEQILEELGEPRMIAMTLIDMAALRGQGGSGYASDGDYDFNGNYGSGSSGEDQSSSHFGGSFGTGRSIGGLGCGLGSLVAVVLLLIVLTIVIAFLKFMLPVIAIVVIIGLILSMFRRG
ncbi:MAG: hypothetical protein Q4D52_03170 [Eubacteriales bacterium]|nr:hypothetical protein [Eubacteriales bacterium]